MFQYLASTPAYLTSHTAADIELFSTVSVDVEQNMTTPIPSPPGLPLIGNVFDIDPGDQLNSLMHLADIYGTPILV